LKLPKNNEKRVVELPVPGVMEGLTRLAMGNPHGARPERFVFWNKSRADRPVDYRVFLKGLRKTLEKIGFTKDEARKYEFHGWRHTYATFMSEKIEGKLLRTQTGHKSAAMLARYADHTLEADKAKIRAAQLEAFGRCIGGGNEEIFMQ
jgi:integrase